MERTLETITINNALEVVRLKGELKFKHPLVILVQAVTVSSARLKASLLLRVIQSRICLVVAKRLYFLSSVPAVFLILIMWFGFNHSTKYLSGVAVLLPRYYRGGYYGFWKI